MRFLIFCLLVSFCLCDEYRYFRFRNARFTKGYENSITLSGTLRYQKSPPYDFVYSYGMDYSTMTPLLLVLEYRGGLITDSEIELHCLYGRDGLEDRENLSGWGYLRFYNDRCELSARCYPESSPHVWTFNSTNVETKKWVYSSKEAGFRAKFLIDQSRSKYKPSDIISFAIYDYPYFYDSCKVYLDSRYSNAPGPEPGAIMVGKDGWHCAILDDEGTKFTHSNPVAGRVTYDSIAVAERYFPNGTFYKRSPDV